MKLVLKNLSFVVAAGVSFLAGCTHAPTRPDPSATAPTASSGSNRLGGDALQTQNISSADAMGLQPRTSEFDTNNQNRTALQAVYFEFNQSDIKAAERAKLKTAKEYLDKNPTYRVLLEGHCDWRGTAEYNLALGERRANAVKAYLASIGVSATKLETISKGSLEASKKGDDATMSKDRRVDLVVLGPAGAPSPL